jgi:hypothetical protein
MPILLLFEEIRMRFRNNVSTIANSSFVLLTKRYTLDRENDQKMLERISRYDYEKVHRRLSRKRLKGTGQWFIDHPTFQEWFDGNGPSSLWCSGKSTNYPSNSRIVSSRLIGFYLRSWLRQDHDSVSYAITRVYSILLIW